MILGILKQIPFFAELDSVHHEAIIENIRMHFYPADYILFHEGDEADKMYILKSGSVKVFHPKVDFEEDLAILSPGSFFGEMALISQNPRNASVKTLEDCELFSLSRKDLQVLMENTPAIAQAISEAMVERTDLNERRKKGIL